MGTFVRAECPAHLSLELLNANAPGATDTLEEGGNDMNDFTKTELTIINHAVYMLNINTLGRCLEIINLSKKIQSMIDNYCEHVSEEDHHVCVDKCKNAEK